MQSVSSGIWTRVAVSISNDDNHYTTGISLIYKNKKDLSVDDQQRLLCHKTKPNQTKLNQTKPNQNLFLNLIACAFQVDFAFVVFFFSCHAWN